MAFMEPMHYNKLKCLLRVIITGSGDGLVLSKQQVIICTN